MPHIVRPIATATHATQSYNDRKLSRHFMQSPPFIGIWKLSMISYGRTLDAGSSAMAGTASRGARRAGLLVKRSLATDDTRYDLLAHHPTTFATQRQLWKTLERQQKAHHTSECASGKNQALCPCLTSSSHPSAPSNRQFSNVYYRAVPYGSVCVQRNFWSFSTVRRN